MLLPECTAHAGKRRSHHGLGLRGVPAYVDDGIREPELEHRRVRALGSTRLLMDRDRLSKLAIGVGVLSEALQMSRVLGEAGADGRIAGVE